MTKGITRTLVTTEISVAKFENGELLPLEPIIVDKEITKEEAIKLTNKKYKDADFQAIVTEVSEPKSEKRRISIEDFVKYSEVIEGAEQEELELTETHEQEVSGF